MKNIKNIALLAALISTVACTTVDEQVTPTIDQEDSRFRLTFSTTESADTKVDYTENSDAELDDEAISVTWKDGDKITLYRKSSGEYVVTMTLESGAGSTSATFVSDDPDYVMGTNNYYAVYPGTDAATYTDRNEEISTEVETQTVSSDLSTLGDYTPMSATFTYNNTTGIVTVDSVEGADIVFAQEYTIFSLYYDASVCKDKITMVDSALYTGDETIVTTYTFNLSDEAKETDEGVGMVHAVVKSGSWANHTYNFYYDEDLTSIVEKSKGFKVAAASRYTLTAVPSTMALVTNYTTLNTARSTIASGGTIESIVLLNDIEMDSNSSWAGIGTSSCPFSGTFYGNDYTVTGLYVSATTNASSGLFGVLGGGTVKDVTVKDANILTKGGGILCGSSTLPDAPATIDNCHVVGGSISGTVSGSALGTIIGTGSYVYISNCSNSASVSVDGIDTTSKQIGGVIGAAYNEPFSVVNCTNSGDVTGHMDANNGSTGGIIGLCNIGTGTVVVTENCHNSGTISGGIKVGGIAGSHKSDITACSNSGEIIVPNGATYVGGVVGGTDWSLLTACYNTGDIKVNDQDGLTAVGGICGDTKGATIIGCYNTGAATHGCVASNIDDKTLKVYGTYSTTGAVNDNNPDIVGDINTDEIVAAMNSAITTYSTYTTYLFIVGNEIPQLAVTITADLGSVTE